MRPWEINGDMYNFISEEEFKDSIEADEFLEYAFVHQAAYYGTKKADVLDGIAAGNTIIKEVDMAWLEEIQKNFPDLRESYTSIFLDVPEDTMIERNLERNPNTPQEEIDKRIHSLKNEKAKASELCDYIVDATQTPEKVMEGVLEIMKKES